MDGAGCTTTADGNPYPIRPVANTPVDGIATDGIPWGGEQDPMIIIVDGVVLDDVVGAGNDRDATLFAIGHAIGVLEALRNTPSLKPLTVPPVIHTPESPPWTKMPLTKMPLIVFVRSQSVLLMV